MNEYHYEPLHYTVIKMMLLVCFMTIGILGENEALYTVGWTLFGIIAIFGVMLPAYNWHRDRANNREYTRREGEAIDSRVLIIEARTRQIEQQQRTIQLIRGLKPEYIKFAEKFINEDALFNIQGRHVSWKVGGMEIPIWFSEMWWEAYQEQPDPLLPPQSAFQGDDIYSREMKRAWSKAITDRLIQYGVVRSPGSRWPARWAVEDERVRFNALVYCGIPWALKLCQFIRENSEEEL